MHWGLLFCAIGVYTKKERLKNLSLCDSGGIQTHNLLIRSQMLYSVELRNPHWLLIFQGYHEGQRLVF